MDPDSRRRAGRGLRVAVTDRLGRPMRVPGLSVWLTRIAPVSARGDVALALVSDRIIRTLNRTYRGKDVPTDVLSFAPAPRQLPKLAAHLGDIVISTAAARRQARAAGHSYTVELKILALHGLLHLLGYDHDSPSDRGRMARLERGLRAKGGLCEGLIERASMASEPRERRAPAKRRARERLGESAGRGPSVEK